MTTRILASLTIALAALTAAGCGNAKLRSTDIAVVCGQHVTQAQYGQILNQQKAQAGGKLPKVGTSEYESMKQQLVQILVQRAAYQHKADQLGIKVSDKKVKDQLAEIITSRYGGKRSAFLADIKKSGLDEKAANDIVRFSITQDELKKKIVKDVTVSDKDALAYYNKNKATYLAPTQRQVAHILVKTKAEADALEKQIKGGADFAALAKKHSTDTTSAVAGGELTAKKGQLVPEFEKVAFALKTGVVSAPVKSQYGFHIIKALGPVKPAHQQTFKEVEPLVKQTLTGTKQQEAVTKWVNGVNKECIEKAKYTVGYAPPAAAKVNPTPVNTKTG